MSMCRYVHLSIRPCIHRDRDSAYVIGSYTGCRMVDAAQELVLPNLCIQSDDKSWRRQMTVLPGNLKSTHPSTVKYFIR